MFKELVDVPDEYDSYREREDRIRAERDLMFSELEKEFSDRGLKITWWGGACPTQGYGWLDGDRWYFRFRWNQASLRVGPYDDEIEERVYQDARRRYEKRKIETSDGDSWSWGVVPDKQQADDVTFYPHKVTRISYREGPIPEDDLNGHLETGQEACDFLRSMILDLKEVPEDEQVPIYLRPGWKFPE